MRRLLALCVWWWCGAVAAEALGGTGVNQVVQSDSADRHRIAQSRAEVNRRFHVQEAACYAKFAVNDCLETARRVQRQALGVLSREEMVLNETQRRQSSAERLKAIQAKSQAQADRRERNRQDRALPEGDVRSARIQSQGNPPEEAAVAPVTNPAGPDATRKPRRTDAEKEEALKRFAAKQLEAQQHKDALARKRAAESKPPAAPLPTP